MSFFLAASLIFLSTACDGLPGFPGGVPKTTETLAEPMQGEIVRSARELDQCVAYACENMLSAVKVRLSDISVWDELMDFYEKEQGILVLRGITSLSMSYRTYAGYIDAELIPEYEMYVKVVAAYKSGDSSSLSPEESRVYERAREIVGEHFSGTGTVFEKAFAVHEYLADNVEYDYSVRDDSFNVYGALIDGAAVCSGYAQAFKMFMDILNAECMIVTGEAGGEKHAWNLVNYSGEWYHVDVTWNDQSEIKTRRYLNVNDGIMGRDHFWNGANYPAARGMKYNYYRYAGKDVSTVFALEEFFSSAYSNGERYVEVVCSYGFNADDLSFLSKYAGTFSFATAEYGDGTLLMVILS